MKKHTKIYMKHHGYAPGDFIPCAECGATAVDIHHIEFKGMGGDPSKDRIDNLEALCWKCHDKKHGKI